MSIYFINNNGTSFDGYRAINAEHAEQIIRTEMKSNRSFKYAGVKNDAGRVVMSATRKAFGKVEITTYKAD